ncbi:MAG: ATP-binding cassette domain-containing protein [Ruminococcus sp.]|nr:MAG: ATP-binding cassette domain-containing protein [Ruminococcus sp.]
MLEKSTILRLLTGIYKAESGNVTVDGDEVFDNTDIKEPCVFHQRRNSPVRYIYRQGAEKNYYKGFYPKFSEEVYQELLKTVKLPEDKRIDRFSKGMKRQAIVIIGLACCTDYLLLDEAFDGLDPTMRIIVKRMLVDAMLDRKLTTVISSHNLKEINEVCDSVALLHQGKILFQP